MLALQEARRLLGHPAQYQHCTEQEFNQLLSSSFAGDSGESQQVAAGLEDHPDLLSLADSVPEAEDLMDQEDDAPIVRLINALLSEAIRVGASDIHVESFENDFPYACVSMGSCVKLCSHVVSWRHYWYHGSRSWPSWILQKTYSSGWTYFLASGRA